MNATIEAFKKDVDRTLLRENLKRTPQERFTRFDQFMQSVMELRAAGMKHRQRRLLENTVAIESPTNMESNIESKAE